MRLLTRLDDGSLALTRELYDNIPRYAILSHTWGSDEDEVTFRDIDSDTADKSAVRDKKGYKKLTFCADQAATDGLEHFWVDTCCIDKSSSTELSTAINSMFRWYQKAEKCYVFLSDVSAEAGDDKPRASWKNAFRHSRWMTRGWTLQELVAPRSVEFFSKEGMKLGSKFSLEALLHEITGISVDVLRGKPLADVGINEKFSWLDTRQTKIPEDRAYCMFGLFDVQMPLIYSEGEEKAMNRLRQEVGNKQLTSADTPAGKDTMSELGKQCVADLRITNPRDDKTRIEDTKGGLLADSFAWVFENGQFCQWRDTGSREQSLLWVRGDPGKGKTMLLCGIINHLEGTRPRGTKRLLAYFLCQATDEHINSATAVVRGLVLMLLEQDPHLLSHVEKKYETSGKALFTDRNAWYALCKILLDMLQDTRHEEVWLVVDALDECITGLAQLLALIAQTSTPGYRVKWLVSSRNVPNIEEKLDPVADRLSLEVNASSVAEAVRSYIDYKVRWLEAKKRYKSETTEGIREHLLSRADGTFLWVALVCQELDNTPRWKALQRAQSTPTGLDALYDQMLRLTQAGEDHALSIKALDFAATAFVPLSLAEYTVLLEECEGLEDDLESLNDIIKSCGSFLTVRNDTVYFVHQSAKDFLVRKQSQVTSFNSQATIHGQMFEKSINALSQILIQDNYNLGNPRMSLALIDPPARDPLRAVRYACCYWINHLLVVDDDARRDHDMTADRFLRTKSLCWFEALSLIGRLPVGKVGLQALSESHGSCQVRDIARDAFRVLQRFEKGIQQYPLQVYASTLLFSPRSSLVRQAHTHVEPTWVRCLMNLEEIWSPSILSIEVFKFPGDLAYSPDGRYILSGSRDDAIELRNAASGVRELQLNGSKGVFTPDGQSVIKAHEELVEIWDASEIRLKSVFHGHESPISALIFSVDGRYLATSDRAGVIKIWDLGSGICGTSLKTRPDENLGVALSPDAQRIAVATWWQLEVWDTRPKQAVELTPSDGVGFISCLAFSSDGQSIVTGSYQGSLFLSDVATGRRKRLRARDDFPVRSVGFSPDGQHIVSVSKAGFIGIWNTQTGRRDKAFHYATHSPDSMAVFSTTGNHVIAITPTDDCELWEVSTGCRIDRRHIRRSYNYMHCASSGVVTMEGIKESGVETALADWKPNLSWRRHLNAASISRDRRWIIRQSRKRLWLPAEYRADCLATFALPGRVLVAFGSTRGQLSVLEFTD
ncbi:hypothetical protein Micbo1qcDRAFT_216290 [Microdochium bolleyi]|uniref:NACHT domain-containing protein n=1 Tax=Microdochium bolleyi TaxID=196109 RepID=A0A136IQS0_9PEZI|nr:hypothetical protein Micbo1qcDRAFT_216290 [Microdochium bolleyi]